MTDMRPTGDKDQRSQVSVMVLTTGYDMYVFILASFLAKTFHSLKMAGFRTGCTNSLDSVIIMSVIVRDGLS